MSPRLKSFSKLSELSLPIPRNSTAVAGIEPEGRYGVQIIKSLPVFDSEGAWEMTCVVTGRKFSPIQVPAHFLKASVCNGQAYKKLMDSKRSKRRK